MWYNVVTKSPRADVNSRGRDTLNWRFSMYPHSTTNPAPLCACGCGQFTIWRVRKNGWNTYIHGHQSRRPVEDRFWEKVDKNGPIPDHCPERGPCWIWMGSRKDFGYGDFARDGRLWLAHRVSWEIHYGPVPDGIQVCHQCDNPSCVRPDHLFLGTQTDNVQDCLSKGRHRTVHGENAHSCRLTTAHVLEARRLYSAGGFTKLGLSKQFGISRTAMRNIIDRKRWCHLN